MAIEIKAPAFPESIVDGEVAAWHKSEGEAVARDELIVEIETDKIANGVEAERAPRREHATGVGDRVRVGVRRRRLRSRSRRRRRHRGVSRDARARRRHLPEASSQRHW